MKPTLFFTIIAISAFVLMGVMHEMSHQEIYRSYGVDSYITIKGFSLVTVGEEPCPNMYCTLAHNNADAFTYPLTGFYVLIFMGLLFIIKFLEELWVETLGIQRKKK